MLRSIPVLRTVNVMAAELGVTPQRLRWLLKHHPDINPRAFADGQPVFDKAAVDRLTGVLRKTKPASAVQCRKCSTVQKVQYSAVQ